jgi:exosortase/archaeosortase family protein
MSRRNPDQPTPGPLERRPRFLLTVALYAVFVLTLSLVLLSDLVFDDLLHGLRLFVAQAAAWTLALAGMPVTSHGEVISGPGTALLIVNECTGIDATILLVSAVLVFPAGWREKLIGVGLATAVMMGTNFVRVLALTYIGNYHGPWLEVGHLYVWPVVVILAGVGTLLFWAERIALPRTA